MAERPRSVLDVGCGTGSLIRWLQEGGIAAEGVEADAGFVEQLRADGYVAHQVDGERLPFADDAFDIVASEFTAHHFAHPTVHLAEALRVAKLAVWLLDAWYDTSVESQRRTLRWDSWCKRIDRRQGKVHNEVLSAADFLAALPGVAPERVEFRHWLHLAPIDLAWFDDETAAHLDAAAPAERDELVEIRRELIEHGMTDDGAIVVRIDCG